MLSALTKAFGQAPDPAFRRVFGLSLAASIAVFILLWAVSWLALAWVGDGLAAWVVAQDWGETITGVLTWLFGAGSLVGVLVASFFLFPAVMVLVMSFLLEEIANAVEARHYPSLAPARDQPLAEQALGALVFAGITLAVNLVALPLYLLLLFVPPLNLFVFYLINGYLLGREYFELVAVRRLNLTGAKRLRRAYRGRVLLAGVVIAFLLTLPIVNLVMPIIATSFMLHIFEVLRQRAEARGTGHTA
jgi:uncharacterized protein involved in cysteine biosynthesis